MCLCMRVFPKSRTQRDTTKCVLLLVYHEFTKIEATPMRHDFFSRDAPVITFLLRFAMRHQGGKKKKITH